MVEWIKLLPDLLHGKPAMIFAIFVAIVAFAPIDGLQPVREEYSVVLPVAGALAVAVVIGNFLYWLKGGEVMQWLRRWRDQSGRKKTFKQLSETQQLLVLDLYFGGHASGLRFDDEKDEIRELLNEDFVETSWVDSSFGCPLQLTPSARGFIRGDKEQKKVLRKELIDKGIREKIYKLSVR